MDGDRWKNLLEQVRANRGLDYLKDMRISRDFNLICVFNGHIIAVLLPSLVSCMVLMEI